MYQNWVIATYILQLSVFKLKVVCRTNLLCLDYKHQIFNLCSCTSWDGCVRDVSKTFLFCIFQNLTLTCLP